MTSCLMPNSINETRHLSSEADRSKVKAKYLPVKCDSAPCKILKTIPTINKAFEVPA